MSLVIGTLETAIINAFKANVPNATTLQTSQINALAVSLATAIDDYIKSATVTVNTGIPVSTTGTSVAQTGATTAPGTGSLS